MDKLDRAEEIAKEAVGWADGGRFVEEFADKIRAYGEEMYRKGHERQGLINAGQRSQKWSEGYRDGIEKAIEILLHDSTVTFAEARMKLRVKLGEEQ